MCMCVGVGVPCARTLPLRVTATEVRGEKKLNLVAYLSFLSP